MPAAPPSPSRPAPDDRPRVRHPSDDDAANRYDESAAEERDRLWHVDD